MISIWMFNLVKLPLEKRTKRELIQFMKLPNKRHNLTKKVLLKLINLRKDTQKVLSQWLYQLMIRVYQN
jgi:hypothetical protein